MREKVETQNGMRQSLSHVKDNECTDSDSSYLAEREEKNLKIRREDKKAAQSIS